VLLTASILILEEPETPKPQSKPEEKENKTVEDPEEELIEDDIDDEDVDDPDDEVIEIESNQVKKETPSTSSSRDQPQQTRQGTLFSLEFQSQNYKYFLVIEVDENDVPNEWRRVLYLDRQNMERLCDFDLSDGYTRGIPTSSKQI